MRLIVLRMAKKLKRYPLNSGFPKRLFWTGVINTDLLKEVLK